MLIEVETNPNCSESPQLVLRELGPYREVSAIRVGEGATEKWWEVIGVDDGGRWVPARAAKIADSSDGVAFLIAGSAWGIRLRSPENKESPWDLKDDRQKGEPFKIYGSEEDILYAQ